MAVTRTAIDGSAALPALERAGGALRVGVPRRRTAGHLPPDIARPLRVLHVVEAFGGGVFEQLRHLTARLPHEGVISVIAHGRRAETPADVSQFFAQDVELLALPWGARTLRGELAVARRIRQVISDSEPDVVHLHSSFAGVAGTRSIPQSIPRVYTPHGYSFMMPDRSRVARAVFRGMERFVADRVDVIGAVSVSERRAAASLGAVRAVLVENGIPEFDGRGAPAAVLGRERAAHRGTRPVVVAMGRITAFRRPADTVAILRGVGDLADVEWIGEAALASDRLGVERCGVPVTGWLTRTEALARLRRADVYVHCAAWEGQPMAVLEAMALGSAVVGTDIPPLRDLIPEGQRFETPEQAVAIVRDLLVDDVRMSSCIAAQQRVGERHGANRMARRWAQVYRELASGRLRRPAGRRGGPRRGAREVTAVTTNDQRSTTHMTLTSEAPTPQNHPCGRVMVTGCAGFIGSHVTEALLNRGAEVVGIDCFNDNYDRHDKLRNLEAARSWDQFDFFPVDLARGNLEDLVCDCDAVIHLAAEPGVRPSWSSRFGDYLRNNVQATQELLEAVKRHSDTRIVYASSSSIYGEALRQPTSEDELPKPFSPYGMTKLAGEHLCQLYHLNFGLRVVSLRYFSVYGPRQRPDMAFHRFCSAAVTPAGSQVAEPITVYGDGTQTRDFTFVDDVVQATLSAAVSDSAASSSYNVGGGSQVSVNEALGLIADFAGRPLEIDYTDAQRGDVRATSAAIERAERDLGLAPATSVRDGLAAEFEWMLSESRIPSLR